MHPHAYNTLRRQETLPAAPDELDELLVAKRMRQATLRLAADDPNLLITSGDVCTIFDISKMTLWRWTHGGIPDFPPTIRIAGRNYYNAAAMLQFIKARNPQQLSPTAADASTTGDTAPVEKKPTTNRRRDASSKKRHRD